MKGGDRERCLIVTADDYGLCQERDLGIIECFKTGLVTGATMLMNGEHVEDAIALAKLHGLPLGLHLNLTEGPPMCSPSEVSSLLTPGEWPFFSPHALPQAVFRGKFGFRDALANNEIDLRHVENEIRAQLRHFVGKTQSFPTHVDGHQHVHVLPAVAEVLARILTQEWGVHRIRLPADQQGVDSGHWIPEPRRQFYRQVLQDCETARDIFARYGLKTTDAFMGLSLMGSDMTLNRINDRLSSIPAEVNSVELMCHVGFPSTWGDEFNQSIEREHEKHVLSDPSLQTTLYNLGFTLRSYADAKLATPPCTPLHPLACPPSKSLNIVILSVLALATGNMNIANRLKNVLRSLGHRVYLRHVFLNGREAVASLEQLIETEEIDMAIGIHLLRSGMILKDCSVPYVMILGGTDVNVSLKTNEWVSPKNSKTHKGMRDVLIGAHRVIGFHQDMTSLLLDAFSSESTSPNSKTQVHKLESKVTLVRQAVETSVGPPWLKKKLGLSDSDSILLFPTGLRPVKDPLFLLSAPEVVNWLGNHPRLHIVVIGSVLDSSYATKVREAVRISNDLIREQRLALRERQSLGDDKSNQLLDAIIIHESVPNENLKAAIQESVTVLNSSLSEGMSNAILEAMALHRPVLARFNSGNASLIKHNETGLLYTSVQEFVQLATELLSSPHLVQTLTTQAGRFIDSNHSLDQETKAYREIVEDVRLSYFKYFDFEDTELLIYSPTGVHPVSTDNLGMVRACTVREGDTVLDLGCGSGIFGLFAACSGARFVTCADVDGKAVAVARKNARRNGLDGRMRFVVGDFLEPLKGQLFDLILFNPPQTPAPRPFSRPDKYGGTDGAAYFKRLMAQVDRYLAPNGRICTLHIGLSNPKEVELAFSNQFEVTVRREERRSFVPYDYDQFLPGLFDYLKELNVQGVSEFERNGEVNGETVYSFVCRMYELLWTPNNRRNGSE